MEFLYRAGDERRSRSPSQQTLAPSPAPNASSASADGQPASGADANKAGRQAEKARILKRILREETVDRFDLELEVRLDLVERFRQRCILNTRGPPPLARAIEANSSSPVAPMVNSKASAPAASPTKRKSSVHGAASSASVETNSKKQKLSLTCTVCANTEKAMQDHLNGKRHKKKAAALAAQPTTRPEPEPEPEPEDAEEEQAVFTAACGEFKPMKFTMVTNQGTLNQVTQMDGYLLCEVCNVRTADRVTMMCHFEGTKHISRAQKKNNASPVASANGGKEQAAKAQVIDKDTAAVDKTANQIEASLVKSMQEKVGDRSSEPQEKIMAPSANKYVVAVETSKALLGKEAVKVSTGAPPAVANAVGDTDLIMELYGVRHALQRVEGILLCPCCDVKTTSESDMRYHLVGKKHKKKMASTTRTAEVNVPETAKAAGEAEADKRPPMTVIAKNAAVASMELDAPAEVESVITPTEPADDTTEPDGKPMKVQVEGKMFTVLRQENGRLSCEICGVHGCNKDAMLKHLYTRMHWDKACLAAEELVREAAAALINDGNGGSPAAEGTALVKN